MCSRATSARHAFSAAKRCCAASSRVAAAAGTFWPLRATRALRPRTGAPKAPPIELDDDGLERFTALKAWRAEVAREHNLPAYVVFHDATLAEMARSAPQTLDDLAQISGVGAKKLEAYGREILRVLGAA